MIYVDWQAGDDSLTQGYQLDHSLSLRLYKRDLSKHVELLFLSLPMAELTLQDLGLVWARTWDFWTWTRACHHQLCQHFIPRGILTFATTYFPLISARSPSIFISPLGKFVIVLTPYACNAIALKSLKKGTLDVVELKGTTLTAKVLKPECVTVPIVAVPSPLEPPPPVTVTVGVEV